MNKLVIKLTFKLRSEVSRTWHMELLSLVNVIHTVESLLLYPAVKPVCHMALIPHLGNSGNITKPGLLQVHTSCHIPVHDEAPRHPLDLIGLIKWLQPKIIYWK